MSRRKHAATTAGHPGRYQHWHECKVCGAKLDMENHSDPNNDHKCDACGAKTSDHELTAEKVDDKYLKSAATCIAKAVYYKSCAICGEKGTDTFEIAEKIPIITPVRWATGSITTISTGKSIPAAE